MKRPKFFEDLDRSLSGEEVAEEPASPLVAAAAQYQSTDAQIAQQAAMMRQCVGMDSQRMQMQAMLEINAGQFNAATVRSTVCSSIDFFPYDWRRR